MPCETIWEKHGVVWNFKGEITEDLVDQVNQDTRADPRFGDIEYWICDYSNATSFSVSTEMLRRYVELDKATSAKKPNIKLAFIPGPVIVKGLINMYLGHHSMLGVLWEAGVFDTQEAAREWVGAV